MQSNIVKAIMKNISDYRFETAFEILASVHGAEAQQPVPRSNCY